MLNLSWLLNSPIVLVTHIPCRWFLSSPLQATSLASFPSSTLLPLLPHVFAHVLKMSCVSYRYVTLMPLGPDGDPKRLSHAISVGMPTRYCLGSMIRSHERNVCSALKRKEDLVRPLVLYFVRGSWFRLVGDLPVSTIR